MYPGTSERGRALLLLASAWAAPLLVRCVLVLRQPGGPDLADAPGFASDLAVSLVLTSLLAVLARRGLLALALVLVPWSLVQYANFEHVSELGAGLQLRGAGYLADPTFLLGSALSPTRPLLLAAALVLPLAIAAVAVRRREAVPGVALLTAGIGLAVLVGFVPRGEGALAWRERHPLQEGLARAFGPAPGPEVAPLDLVADLAGEPLFDLPRPGTNVILLVLEGLSGLTVEAIADHHDVASPQLLESLSRAADRGLVATNFVLHQRQTNRGLYALLCGAYPKLDGSLAKMTLYLEDDRRDCLPRILARHGYRSAYLQGAPLSFMYKDAFMPRAGFDFVQGANDFDEPWVRSFWGVDDRSLLERALVLVDELRAEPGPWLLTVLSVGTHHPEVLPDDYEGEGPRAAISYLDLALGAFLAGLEARGVLDDTLVLVTSDESRGERLASDLATALSSSWGPLVALVPGGRPRRVDAPTGQVDVALSIVDFLGIDADATPFVGRSLFRRYAAPRRVYFANLFQHRVGAFDGRGSLTYCDEPLSRCAVFRAPPDRVFSPEPEPREADARELEEIRAALAASREGPRELGGRFELALTGEREVRVRTVPEHQLLHGQNLDFPPGSLVEVAIELVAEGAGRLDLAYRMTERGMPDHASWELHDVRPGDRAVIRYALRSPEGMRTVKFALVARADRPDTLSVRFLDATVRVRPMEGAGRGLLGEPRVEVVRAAP